VSGGTYVFPTCESVQVDCVTLVACKNYCGSLNLPFREGSESASCTTNRIGPGPNFTTCYCDGNGLGTPQGSGALFCGNDGWDTWVCDPAHVASLGFPDYCAGSGAMATHAFGWRLLQQLVFEATSLLQHVHIIVVIVASIYLSSLARLFVTVIFYWLLDNLLSAFSRPHLDYASDDCLLRQLLQLSDLFAGRGVNIKYVLGPELLVGYSFLYPWYSHSMDLGLVAYHLTGFPIDKHIVRL
jgi:hypothetical protein